MTGLQLKAILVAAVYGLLAGVIAYFITTHLTAAKRSTDDRVKSLIGTGIGDEIVLEKKANKVKFSFDAFSRKGNNDYVQRKSLISRIGSALEDELFASDIVMKPEEFATLWIIVAFVPSSLAALFSPSPVVPVLLAAIGLVSPFAYIRFKKRKRTAQFEDQLGDALMLMSSSLRSGLSLNQAMATISRDMYPPISEEFARAVNEVNMGYSMDEAMEHINRRIDSADFKIVSVAIAVQRTTGGNLSDILNVISQTIKERAALKKEIKAITASGRTTGTIIGLMPVAITLILNVASPGYMDTMFSTSGGRVAVGIGIALEIVGLIVIRKLITIKM